VAASPHPWALLRDRLDPELAAVAWALPGQAAALAAELQPWPWAVAADDVPAGRAATPPGRPILFFVADASGGWDAVAAAVARSLSRRLAGLRLAPERGLELPDGRVVTAAPELEALLGAGEMGLEMVARHRRRAQAQLRRLPGLALGLRSIESRLVLEASQSTALGGEQPGGGRVDAA
jgi:hypothetical protein